MDTLYPVAPEGDPLPVVPAPFTAELQRRLAEIGKQDLGAAR